MILLCISLLANEVECFSHAHWSVFVKCPLKSFAHVFYWSILSFIIKLYEFFILNISSLSDVCIANISSLPVAWLFIFLMVPFDELKF